MTISYTDEDIAQWRRLSPEERLLAAEELWEEFLIKYPHRTQPFWKSFDSFEAFEQWRETQQDPLLW